MTDKVQKIKEWICKEQDGLMDAQGNFEYPEHEGAYHILCNLDSYIDSMQEEPKFKAGDIIMQIKTGKEVVINSITDGLYLCDIYNEDGDYSDDYCFSVAEQDQWKLIEDPANEDLEKEMESFFIKMQVQENENIFEDTFKNIARYFAAWQKQQMKKDAIEAEYWDCSLILDGGMRDMFEDGDKVKLIIIKEDEQ